MPLLMIFDSPSRRVREFIMDADGQLPFLTHLGCSLRDYCGGTVPEIVWVDRTLLSALDDFTAFSAASYRVSGGFSLHKGVLNALGGTVELSPVSPPRMPKSDRLLALNRCGFLLPAPLWGSGKRITLSQSICPPFLAPGIAGTAVCLLEWIIKKRCAYPRITGIYTNALEQCKRRFFDTSSTEGISREDLIHLFRLTRS